MTTTSGRSPWLRLLVEGVVIVASILMAFGIDAWWDARQDRRSERVALEALRAEFASNIESFRNGYGFQTRLGRDVKQVLDRLVGASPGSVVEVPDSVAASMVTSLTLESRNGTVTALIASGRIEG